MKNKKLILVIASMGVFVEALDIAIVNLAIPSIEKSFHLGSEVTYMLQSFYVMVYGACLILGGKLSDVYGKKKVFITGASIFLITSIGAGLSGSFETLLFFRATQGLGAALLMPSAFAICHYYFTEPKERSKAVGIFSAFAAVGSGSGLSLGGIIASYLGWPWVFLINVPILIFIIVVALRYLENDQQIQQRRPDFISALMLIVAMFALTYSAELLPDFRHHAVLGIAVVIVAMVSLLLLRYRLKRQEYPLIDLSLFNIRSLRSGNVLFILLGAIFTSYLFLISLILQQNYQFTAARSGLLLVPFSVVSALVAKFMIPMLTHRFSIRGIAIMGAGFMLMGSLCCLLSVQIHNLPVLLMGGACIAGFGMTLCFTGFSVIAMEQVPSSNLGVGSSLTTTAYFLGGGIGLPVVSFFLDGKQGVGPAPLIVMSLFALIGLMVLSVLIRREGKEKDIAVLN